MSGTQATAALDEWQKKLETHFKVLSEERALLKLPVFAIEHELDSIAIAEISEGLRGQLLRSANLASHWLLWVVYAAELGYDYDGDEYWSSFEKRTPYWRADAGRRQLLRNWYLKFHNLYAGLVPTGPWASHFSIISWPIAHALLPKDLQTQLSRVLYEQRYFVAEFIDSPASQVGHLIAASAYHSSSRMRNFLEQEELVGRIVLALLGSSGSDSTASIRDVSLRRIVADLEAAREAKEWLHEARTVLESARIRMLAKRQALSGVDVSDSKTTDETIRVEGRGIRPHLTLIREAVDGWGAIIEIPSFSGLAGLSARNATFLRATRCTIAGAAQTWNAKGWLLHGNQKKRLTVWPDSSKPIVRFEKFDEAIFHILTQECRVSNGPVWVFRVNGDGTASEVLGGRLRSGTEYILVGVAPFSFSSFLRPVSVSCEGIGGAALKIPQEPTDELLQLISGFGLKLRRTLRIWPVGLPPVHWDGETQIEWFHGESLCLALSHDMSCEGLSLRLDSGKALELKEVRRSQTILVDIGLLPIGSHTLTVDATYKDAATAKVQTVISHSTLAIHVRPIHRWIPGTSGHAGLVVSIEPHEPTLDGMLSGGTNVSILGPEGRVVTCRLDLLDAGGGVLASECLGTPALPVSKGQWRDLLNAFAKRDLDASLLLRASAGQLIFEADGLGGTKIPLSHTVVPIRWIAKGSKNIELTLIDDTGHEDPMSVEHVTFLKPTSSNRLEDSDSIVNIRPEGHGGLYIASTGPHRAKVLVSLPGRGSLQDLADKPALNFPLRSGGAVASLLRWLGDWSTARAVGPLAEQRRAIVLRSMEEQLLQSMCGPGWFEAESHFLSVGLGDVRAKERLENAVHRYASFAVCLSRDRETFLTDSIEESAERLLGHAILHHICGDQIKCEAALRLMATPTRFADWAGPDIVKKLDALVEVQSLLKGVRLMVLLLGDEAKRRTSGWAP